MHCLVPTSLSVLFALSVLPFTGGDANAENAKAKHARAEAIKKEMKRLEGTWELVFTGMNGGEFKQPQDEKPYRLIIQAEGIPPSRLSIDPSTRPKTWTVRSKWGDITVGIYDFMSDDELHICTAFRDRPRPTDFTFNPGSSQVLQVWRRVKEKK